MKIVNVDKSYSSRFFVSTLCNSIKFHENSSMNSINFGREISYSEEFEII